ncbi:FAD-dependent 2-octaprenylphenol hydroxylase [Lonsdalea populi]|uniref:FAD-dependent 2-octaprenylphenol hydroxylase n=1 Tax=Lonsdalea populi TaxID=1172565 RepID=UPI00215E3FBC|nr:FAD-dependent 2-octaprenylphenol hydroxylase [Lonsdalea populi]
MQSFDVVITGGGMVGLALACGLQGCGLRIAVLEKQPVNAPDFQQGQAPRVSAINAASEQLLRKLGVWETIAAQRISPYNKMSVWDRDSFGSISFNGEETGFPISATSSRMTLSNNRCGDMQNARVTSRSSPPAALKQVAWGENEAFITLEDGSMLTARLVVGADGAHSWLRQHADIPLTFWDYGHHALVANIRTQRPHDSVARQVFHGDGMLAFLPLSDPHLCSIVWSLPPERAQTMLEAPAETFNSQLAAEFDMRLGLCELESERQRFPLTARYARNFAAHRLVLIGDAAHTIHPLAGQGVNLGFMDVAELIAELKRLQSQGKDIGQYLHLRRYERRRKHSAAVMLASMQGFRDLFAGSHPAKKLLRDVGLKLADTLPGIKPTLVRQAMGFHDMPDWLEEQR